MNGYRGFPSKQAYEEYYSKGLPQWELDAMDAYTKEAEAERLMFMSDTTKTKACNLTEDEITVLLQYHARQIAQSTPEYDNYIERIKYLNSRLKTFKELKIKSEPNAAGWSSNNG